MRRLPGPIEKLCGGSLESIKNRFSTAYPTEEVIATFSTYVVSKKGLDYVRRDLSEAMDFIGEQTIWSASNGDALLEARRVAEKVASDAMTGAVDPEDMDLLVGHILSGNSFTVASVKESIMTVLVGTSVWRSFYREFEPRIRKLLRGELGKLTGNQLQPKFRDIRLGELDKGASADAMNSIRLSLREVASRLDALHQRALAIQIPNAPVGRMDLEHDYVQFRALKASLEAEIVRIYEYIVGIDVTTGNLEDAAVTYDLLTEELYRYEVMLAFFVRAINVASMDDVAGI